MNQSRLFICSLEQSIKKDLLRDLQLNSAEENKTHSAASYSPVDGKTAPSGDKRDTGDSSMYIFICQKQ